MMKCIFFTSCRQAEIQRHQEILEKDIQSRLQEQNIRTQGLESAAKSQK